MKVTSISEVTIAMTGEEASRMAMRLRAVAMRCCNYSPRYMNALSAWGCDTCRPIRDFAAAIERRDD